GKTGIFLHLRSGSLSTRPGLAAAIEAKTARSIPGERSGEYIIPRTPRAAGQPLLVCRSHRGRLYTGFGTRSKEGDLLHRLIRSRHPRSAWPSTTNTSPASRPQPAGGAVSRWNRPRPRLGTVDSSGEGVPMMWEDPITENPARGATEIWEMRPRAVRETTGSPGDRVFGADESAKLGYVGSRNQEVRPPWLRAEMAPS